MPPVTGSSFQSTSLVISVRQKHSRLTLLDGRTVYRSSKSRGSSGQFPALSTPSRAPSRARLTTRCFSATSRAKGKGDPCLQDLGREISNDYARLREHYAAPKHPVVLAHGLLGFSELKLAGGWLPAVHYWHGIETALAAEGIKVFCASVPPSHSIQARAEKLARYIAEVAAGESVNIVAHSMGGLDSRYMISHLNPRLEDAKVSVKSLVTVATPHHGSTFSDYLLDAIGPKQLPSIYHAVERVGLGTEAFEQLTRRYMVDEFNPNTPDDPAVRYFSFGARISRPPLLSPFRLSHRVIEEKEGPNDGLVSVASSKWGTYKGTLVGVSHLDLINWSNRVRWTLRRLMGMDRSFNAIAFYLDIADMLAKEGL